MINRAKFKNFKALRDVEITFDSRLTVLVGPNGSGKTSILQGLNYLTRLAREANEDPETQFQGVLEYLSIGQTGANYLLDIEGRKENLPYGIRVEARDGKASLQIRLPERSWPQASRSLAIGRIVAGTIREIQYRERSPEWSQESFDHSAIVEFDARRLAAPIVPRVNKPLLARDGSGLAAALVQIRNQNEDAFKLIENTFSRVIHNAVRIRFDQREVPGTQGLLGYTLLIDFKGAEGVQAKFISSGTLYALGLLTVLFAQDSPSVVLVDDLDHGLHPMAQADLIGVLRIVLCHRPELQIIATSHSPYILDKLKWNEVRVTSLQDDGSAICKPLSDHPLYPKWKESMSPGEFWSYSGEDWVKNGKPEPVAQ